MKKNKNHSYLQIIIILLIFLIFLVFYFLKTQFSNLSLEEIIFHLKVPLKDSSNSYLEKGIEFCLNKFLLTSIFLLAFNYIMNNLNIKIRLKKIKKEFILNKIYIKLLKYILVILTIFIYIQVDKWFHLTTYIKNQINSSSLYEEFYVKPDEVKIKFTKNKNNLIYIFIESLETTDISKENGGARINSLIPNLEKIALNNINFSNTDKIGGQQQVNSTGWTAAALIAQTSGVPLKIYGGLNGNNYNEYEYFLKSTVSIGEILKENGYKNYFLMGSNKDFGGRGPYFENHGEYQIYDFKSAKEDGKIPSNYDIDWWGFEDKKLYEYAKEQLLEISKKEESFNFTMLTVDTHPYGGYLDETCKTYDNLTHYQNVVKCADNMLNEFIDWIKNQPFYKNTTIVIVGDHLNQVIEDIYEDIDPNYIRTNLNIFINAKVDTKCNKNRIFTAMDLYPTTIAALGADIQGQRLALGTNLFSCEKTLAEQFGINELSNELALNSKYYSKCLFHGEC